MGREVATYVYKHNLRKSHPLTRTRDRSRSIHQRQYTLGPACSFS